METILSLTKNWWVLLVRGLVGVLVGLAFLAYPGKSLEVIVLFMGVLVMLDSVAAIILSLLSIKNNPRWWTWMLSGIVGVIVGMVIFNWPQLTVGLVLFLIAIWILVGAISMFVMAIALHRESYGSWFFTALGILALVVALVMFANPEGTVKLLVVLTGVYVFVAGIMTTAYALELRHVRSDAKKLA